MGNSLRRVQDPSVSDSEFLYRQEQERERAKKMGRPASVNVGTVVVEENARTRIGGLANIKAKRPHHEKAAELFKSHYENLYGNGLGATDAGRVQVDTSKTAHDSGMAASLDRNERLEQVRVEIGRVAYDLIVAVIVLQVPLKDFVAPELSERSRKSAVKAKRDELFAALEGVCKVWNL